VNKLLRTQTVANGPPSSKFCLPWLKPLVPPLLVSAVCAKPCLEDNLTLSNQRLPSRFSTLCCAKYQDKVLCRRFILLIISNDTMKTMSQPHEVDSRILTSSNVDAVLQQTGRITISNEHGNNCWWVHYELTPRWIGVLSDEFLNFRNFLRNLR